jgi:hypothetical protein
MYEAETILNRFVGYQYVKNDTKHDMPAMSGFRDMLIDQFAGAVSHASISLNIGFREKCHAKKLLEIKFLIGIKKKKCFLTPFKFNSTPNFRNAFSGHV